MEKNIKYKISFYVPEFAIEKVKNALFLTGAGQYGNYEQVSWQCLGTGQFKPIIGSNPYIGKINEISIIQEYKVEMLCTQKVLKKAILALKSSHPYEEPAYTITKLESV